MGVSSARYSNLWALRLNGTNQYGWMNNPTFKTDTSGCFSFWFKLDALFGANGFQTIIGYGVNNGANNSTITIGPRRLTATGSGTYMNIVTRTTHGGTNNGVIGTTTPLVAGAWMYCEVESNGTAWAMRINNVTQTLTAFIGSNTGDWLGDISGSDHKLVIGNNYNANALGTSWFAGVVDEINYINRTLTGPESTILYNGGTPRNASRIGLGTALKEWWRMGDRGDTTSNVIGRINANNLTLVNTPTLVTP